MNSHKTAFQGSATFLLLRREHLRAQGMVITCTSQKLALASWVLHPLLAGVDYIDIASALLSIFPDLCLLRPAFLLLYLLADECCADVHAECRNVLLQRGWAG